MSANWIPVALGRDIPAGSTRSVVLDGEEIVIWRGEDGVAHVWEDRCPHRGMRLSLGFVRGNSLNCLYHGWQYGASSSCIRIPAHPELTVPPTIRARAYAAREAAGMVWIGSDKGSDAELPPAGVTPVLSLAVDAGGLDAPSLRLPFEGGRLYVYWHRVAAGRIMLHAVLDGAGDTGRAAKFLRGLRGELEQGAVA